MVFDFIIGDTHIKSLSEAMIAVSKNLESGSAKHGSMAASEIKEGIIVSAGVFSKTLGTSISDPLNQTLRTSLWVFGGMAGLLVCAHLYILFSEKEREEKIQNLLYDGVEWLKRQNESRGQSVVFSPHVIHSDEDNCESN